ncbi:hypothetical protein FO519_008029 [Halicephalobus sp. NKZ332]|nr:hypothetical protein FO519_008029 [Halicephalobus sp. NKZ332]
MDSMFNGLDINFNENQKKAIFMMTQPVNSTFILFGPPGTGKTMTLVETIRQLSLKNPKQKFLVCTPSNMAADSFAETLLKRKIFKTNKIFRYISFSRDYFVRNHKLNSITKRFNLIGPRGEILREVYRLPKSRELRKFKIIICTLGSVPRLSKNGRLPSDHFSHIFIDEAAQSPEMESWLAIGYFGAPKTRLILAGDPMQLGPVTTVQCLRPPEHGYKNSMLSRLYKLPFFSGNDMNMIQLTDNYRSHPAIIKMFSDLFYDGSVVSAAFRKYDSLCKIKLLKNKEFPIIFHSNITGQEEESEKKSKGNREEVELVVKYVNVLKDKYKVNEEDIGIVAPYTFQGELIRDKLGRRSKIVVGSVERFQGSEKRVIIISTVRSGDDLGFMADDSRFNTAISRAKELLIVIGSETIKNSKVIQNPISAAIIGMVVTLVLQSSSTLISLLVGMVSGHLITVPAAIPIMMGSEMGASIMNALISLTQSGNRAQFRRAFAAATLNDIFNFLCFLIILPIEILFKPIEKFSEVLVSPLENVHTGKIKTLNFFTDPLLEKIIQIDDATLDEASLSNSTDFPETFVFRCINITTEEQICPCPYSHIFAYSTFSDTIIGMILLLICIISLVLCMYGIVEIMSSLLAGQIAVLLRKLMDKRLPYPFGWLTDYIVMFVGCIVVVIVESSSVFRSALTPLVGIGVLTLERLFPLIIGSNIGTTSTGIVAAFSADPTKLQATLQMAFCQTFYNILCAILFFPIPFMRQIPIKLSMKFGDITAEYRWFAVVYIISVFFLMPAILLGISFLPPPIMFTVLGFLIISSALIITINILQVKFPKILPRKLENWDFLPLWMHSLKPYDKKMTNLLSKIPGARNRFNRSFSQKSEVRKSIKASRERWVRDVAHPRQALN